VVGTGSGSASGALFSSGMSIGEATTRP
jgi:hypothetical protein